MYRKMRQFRNKLILIFWIGLCVFVLCITILMTMTSDTVNRTKHENELYHGILEMIYSNMLNNWSELDGDGMENVYDPDSISYILSHYLSDYALDEIGYMQIDLDDNGQPELLISSFDVAASGMFYDLYTIIDGKVIHLASGGERDRYYLTENNMIHREGSGSAISFYQASCYLNRFSGKLQVKQAVIYDEYQNRENPWFYANTEYYHPDTYEINYDIMTSITEEDAVSYLASFPAKTPLELISFDNYF